MAVPDAFQSYGVFQPDGDKCGSFWPMGGMSDHEENKGALSANP
jgi:hypothetical protein